MIFNFYLILFVLVIHFLADFSLQTHMQATMKSTKPLFLIKHTITYSLVWFICFFIYLGLVTDDTFLENLRNSLSFFMITFTAHTLTDFVTSKMVKERFDKEDFHNGFLIIGVDQVLHYIQLFLTVYLLS